MTEQQHDGAGQAGPSARGADASGDETANDAPRLCGGDDGTDVGGCAVLLVGNHPDDVALLQSLGARSGHEVQLHVVSAVGAALELLARVRIDVVVAALSGAAPGVEAVERLRAAAVEVPVVVLVGADDVDLGVAALQHGAQDFLVRGQAPPAEVERSLRFAVERQRLTHLVTSGALQRQALARLELAGRHIGDLEAFVDQLVEAVGEALPRVELEVDVEVADLRVLRVHGDQPGRVATGRQSLSWSLDGTTLHGSLTTLAPAARPLTDHERSFMVRVADVASVALDAFDTATGKRLRERQLRVLYEVSRALVGCAEATEVLDTVVPHVADALGVGTNLQVTMTLHGTTRHAGEPAGRSVRVEEQISLDGVDVGSLVVSRAASRPWSTEDEMVVAHVAELVGAWSRRRRAERDRDQRRRWTQQLLEQFPAAVWTTDRDLRVTSLQVGSSTLASTDEPDVGGSLVDYLGGEDHAAVANHHRALAGETVSSVLQWQDVWWDVMLAPLEDGDGAVVGVLGMAMDVTEVHRARERAEEASRRYAALFDRSRDAIVLTDEQGRFTDVNDAMCRLVDRSREELLGLRSVDLAPDGAEAERFQSLREVLLEDGSQRGVITLGRPDGTTVEAEYHATANILPGVNLSIVRDVTSEAAMQRALQESEQRFRALAQHAVDGIFRITLTDGRRYEYVNPALERITGFPEAHIQTDPMLLRRRTHPHDVVDDADDQPQTVRFHRADGAWRWLELRQTPIRDEQGQLVAVQGLVLDVTDHKRHADAVEAALAREQEASEELRRLNALRNTFLQAASHELRTPLTAIYGMAATLRRHRRDLDEVQTEALLERLAANAERQRQLLDDLLDLDRLTQDTITPNLQAVDLAEVVRDVTDDFPMGGLHGLELDLAPTPATVEPSKVERIVHNLLANIVKHTPSGTTARIATNPDRDGTAVLVVEDDGPGIDPAVRDEIFEPFVQGAASSAMPQPGTGIGLSLVQQFTELHGGTCTVECPPDGGTRFRLTFPLTSTQPPSAAAGPG